MFRAQMGSAKSKNRNGLTDEEEQEKTQVGRLAFWIRRRWKTSFILFCGACYGFYAYMIDKGKKADGEICAAMRNLEAMYMAMIEMVGAMVIGGVIATFLSVALGSNIRPTELLATSIRVAYRGVSLFTAVVSVGYLSFVITAWSASGICYADDSRKTSQILFSFFLCFGVTIIAIVMNWLERRFTQICLEPSQREQGKVMEVDEDGEKSDVVGLFSRTGNTEYVFEARTLAKALEENGWKLEDIDSLQRRGYWLYLVHNSPGKALLFVFQCIVLLLLTVGYTTTNFQLEIFICKWGFRSLPEYKDKTPEIQAYWAIPHPNIKRMQIAQIWVLPNPGEELIQHTTMFPEVDTSHYDMVFGCGILCSIFTYLFLITYPQFSTDFSPFSKTGDIHNVDKPVRTSTIQYLRGTVPWTMQFGLILLALALSFTGVIFATKSPCGGIRTSPLFYITSTATFCFLAAWVLTFIIFWFITATKSVKAMNDDAKEFWDNMKEKMKRNRKTSLMVYCFVIIMVIVFVVAFATVQAGVNDTPSEPSDSDVAADGNSGSGDSNSGGGGNGDSNSGGGGNGDGNSGGDGDSGSGNSTTTPSTTLVQTPAYEFGRIGFEAFLSLTIIFGSCICCCCCITLYKLGKMPNTGERFQAMKRRMARMKMNKLFESNPHKSKTRERKH